MVSVIQLWVCVVMAVTVCSKTLPLGQAFPDPNVAPEPWSDIVDRLTQTQTRLKGDLARIFKNDTEYKQAFQIAQKERAYLNLLLQKGIIDMISHSAFSTIVTLSVDMKKAQIQVYKAEADLQEIEERFFNVKVKQEGHPGHYVWAQLEKTKRALAARTLDITSPEFIKGELQRLQRLSKDDAVHAYAYFVREWGQVFLKRESLIKTDLAGKYQTLIDWIREHTPKDPSQIGFVKTMKENLRRMRLGLPPKTSVTGSPFTEAPDALLLVQKLLDKEMHSLEELDKELQRFQGIQESLEKWVNFEHLGWSDVRSRLEPWHPARLIDRAYRK